MLPKFPQFKKLELSDKEEVEKITSTYPPYSDFNFVSMWAWDIKGDMRLSVLNGNLVVRFTDYLTGKPFYSFLGDKEINKTAAALLDLAKEESIEQQLKLLPEDLTKTLDTKRFNSKEERDNFDYVYSLDKLSSCQGRDFMTKRNLVNRFVRQYPNALAKICDLNNKKQIKDLLNLSQLWKHHKTKNDQSLNVENEIIALDRILIQTKVFEFITVGIYIDDKLIGFCINEILPGDIALSHFAKADVNSAGAYAFLMRENAVILRKKGKKYLNYEQDLGLKNLRHAKESFRPISFLKKIICAYK